LQKNRPLRGNAIELRILIGVTTRDYPYKINELRRGNPLWLPLTQWQCRYAGGKDKNSKISNLFKNLKIKKKKQRKRKRKK